MAKPKIKVFREDTKKVNVPSVVSPAKKVAAPAAAKTDDRIMFPAKCATCDTDIEVPFKPDGGRPTFCKDCLKDWQRQQAKIQQLQGQKEKNQGGSNSVPKRREEKKFERTISLREATKMKPRTFTEGNARKKKSVNLDEVRQLIKESLDSKK